MLLLSIMNEYVLTRDVGPVDQFYIGEAHGSINDIAKGFQVSPYWTEASMVSEWFILWAGLLQGPVQEDKLHGSSQPSRTSHGTILDEPFLARACRASKSSRLEPPDGLKPARLCLCYKIPRSLLPEGTSLEDFPYGGLKPPTTTRHSSGYLPFIQMSSNTCTGLPRGPQPSHDSDNITFTGKCAVGPPVLPKATVASVVMSELHNGTVLR